MHIAGLCGLLFAQEAERCVRLGEGECQGCVGRIGRGGGVGVVRWGQIVVGLNSACRLGFFLYLIGFGNAVCD